VEATLEKHCPAPRRLSDVYGQVMFVTLIVFLTFISRFIFAPLMPTIKSEVGLSSSGAGTIFLFGSIGLFVGSQLSGVLSARLNHRGTLVLAALVTAATLMACYFAKTAWSVRAAVIVLGLCAGLNQPSVTATVTAMVSRGDWGRALSLQQMGPRLSYAVAPFLAIGLLAAFSWQIALAILGVFAAVCGVAFLIWGDSGGFRGTPPRLGLLAVVMRERSFWIMVFLFTLGVGTQAGIYSMIPVYLTEERGFSTTSANTILGLASIAPVATTFLTGWVTDRFGEKRTLLAVMVASGAAVIAVGSSSGVAMIISIFVLAVLSAGFFPPALAALSRIVQPNFRNLAAGLVPPTAFLLGGGLLPVALGYMGEVSTIGLGMVITGGVVVLGSLAVLGLRLISVFEEGC